MQFPLSSLLDFLSKPESYFLAITFVCFLKASGLMTKPYYENVKYGTNPKDKKAENFVIAGIISFAFGVIAMMRYFNSNGQVVYFVMLFALAYTLAMLLYKRRRISVR